MNNKIFSIILYALLGVSALLSVLFFLDVVSEGMLINWCYILLGIAAVSAIIFPVITMAQNPKNAKNALIGIVGLAVVFAIGYAMAGNEEVFDASAKLLADESTSQLSEAGLNAFYILGLGAIGVIIFSEVSKIFK
jgi:uncharacterized membrane protein YuzA (DUF378 family)